MVSHCTKIITRCHLLSLLNDNVPHHNLVSAGNLSDNVQITQQNFSKLLVDSQQNTSLELGFLLSCYPFGCCVFLQVKVICLGHLLAGSSKLPKAPVNPPLREKMLSRLSKLTHFGISFIFQYWSCIVKNLDK